MDGASFVSVKVTRVGGKFNEILSSRGWGKFVKWFSDVEYFFFKFRELRLQDLM